MSKIRLDQTPSETRSISAGDWKDQSGFCFVEASAFSETLESPALMTSGVVEDSGGVIAIVERVEDEVDGRAAMHAFEDPTNASRISWETLRGRLGI